MLNNPTHRLSLVSGREVDCTQEAFALPGDVEGLQRFVLQSAGAAFVLVIEKETVFQVRPRIAGMNFWTPAMPLRATLLQQSDILCIGGALYLPCP